MKKQFVLPLILLIIFSTSCNKESDTQPYATYETQIMVAGAPNMRDLGGFYGANGKRVLFHKLFRSGDLSKLTTFDLVRNSDNSISIFATDVNPIANPGSLPALSRYYAVAAYQLFNYQYPYMPSGAYNAELVKQLSTEMQLKIQNYGTPKSK